MNDANPYDIRTTEPATTPTTPAAPPEHRGRRRRLAVLGASAALIFAVGGGTGAWAAVALRGAGGPSTTAIGGSTAGGAAPGGGFGGAGTQGDGASGGFGTGGSGSSSGSGSSGSGPFGGFPGGRGSGSGGGAQQGGSGTATAGPTATAAQTAGVVTIVSQLGYESGESAGTGIVLTASGRILTNNHVIDGATAIRVTDESSGRTYDAEVVGTDATEDVAVLQLDDASGLSAARIADSPASTGDAVTAVGNAGGTGTLTTASGSVSDTGERITTESEGATAGETLTGLIETDADVLAGDSGGPLQDADGDVVGITTAASSGTSDPTGYAIPIASALKVATRIVAGDDSDGITLGLPAFLGVSIASGADGAVIGQVLDGTPAASTDLAEGDTVTAVDGTGVDSGSDLTAAIAAHHAGDAVRIAVTDADGASRTITVTLTEGPAN